MMITDAMVGRMFESCRRVLPVGNRTIRIAGDEFKAQKLDESSESKSSMWGAYPNYDCTVIANVDKDVDFENKVEIIWLISGTEKKRRLAEFEQLSDNYWKIGLEAEFTG